MGKKSFYATLFLVLIFIFFLFPSSTGKEFFLVPEQILNLENYYPGLQRGVIGSNPFSLGQYLGFYSDDLKLSFLEKVDYKVSIWENSFINYPKIPNELNIRNSFGHIISSIETTGYPFMGDDKVAVLTDNNISLYDKQANLYWKKEILSIITSLSISEESLLIAYLDGNCELISHSGNKILDYRPGGSRIEAIYSAAISSDGQYISLISGLDPQRFILLQMRKGEYKPIHHFELADEFRRSIKMNFSKDDSLIFFENSKGINIYDMGLKKIRDTYNTGKMRGIYKDKSFRFFSLLLSDSTGGILSIETLDNKPMISKKFYGYDLFFQKIDNRYYVGADNQLMFLKMVER